MDWRRPSGTWIGGHRGANGVAPENTFAGFEAARLAGVDYVETDVRAAADGTLMLVHDGTLERTTDGFGAVADCRPDELAKLDAGGWFGSRFVGQRIPTLEAFLGWIEDVPPLGAILEAKGPGTGGPLARRIAASSATERLAICGFSADELRAARAARPDVVTVLLLDTDDLHAGPVLALTRAADADGAALLGRALTPSRLGELCEAGLIVGAGTRNRPGAVRRALDLAVDLLDSDRPEVALRVRAEARLRSDSARQPASSEKSTGQSVRLGG
jgi:glycerophosphoryl diester phosphodiesterase